MTNYHIIKNVHDSTSFLNLLILLVIQKYESEDPLFQGDERINRPAIWDFPDNIQWTSAGKGTLYSKAVLPQLEKQVIDYFNKTDSTKKITRIEFIKNNCLQKKFEASVMIMSNQGHHNINSPFNQRFTKTSEKGAVLDRISQFYERISSSAKVIQSWIGGSPKACEAICNTGPADLRITDTGYFGAGIYSTLQANYATRYSTGTISGKLNPTTSKGEHVVVLCWIAVGNVYPISRSEDYLKKTESVFFDRKNGLALKPGFDSHCACISPFMEYQAARYDQKTNSFIDRDLRDEIVVKESSQVLPYCVVYFQ